MDIPILEELERLLDLENGPALAAARLSESGSLRWQDWTVELVFDPEGPALSTLLEESRGPM